ncbi:class I adenylate-forming enzyme family protein [Burkholderia glumae]|nr:class I adenylate-forming enzyme family protein [Burkholderia glumae]
MTQTASKTTMNRDPWCYRGKRLTERIIQLTTLPTVIDRHAAGEGMDRPALTWYVDQARTTHWTYREMIADIHCLAAELALHHRVSRGDRVMVISANCPEAYLTYLAILYIGAIAVPVNNVESTRNLQYIAGQVQPVLTVTGLGVGADLLVAIDASRIGTEELLANARARGAASMPSPAVEPDDLAVLLFTSGTTSSPKGVRLSHYNILVNAEGLRIAHALDVNQHHLCILPLFHANAFGFSMIGSVYAGCHTVLCNRFSGQGLWEIASREQINILSAVPEIIRLLGSRRSKPELSPDFRYVVSAAAPLSRTDAASFEKNLGIPIHQGYGLSECTNFAATTPASIDPIVRRRLMNEWNVPSIGPALFGTELKIARRDGSPADQGEEGEILIRGHNVMSGYWRADEETSLAFADGWLHSGDLGFFVQVEEVPYFFVTGRLKEIILRRGDSISPRAVEAELAALSHVGRFAACGFRNEWAGEEIGVYVFTDDIDHALAEVRAIVERCSPRYRPGVVMVGARTIPATVTGKIQRRQLASRFGVFAAAALGGKPRVVADEATGGNG